MAENHIMGCVVVEVMLNEFLKSALDAVEWLELWSGHMDPGYAQDDRLVGSQSHSHRRKRGIRRVRCKRIGEHWTLFRQSSAVSSYLTHYQVGSLNRRPSSAQKLPCVRLWLWNVRNPKKQ
jgi:hypothetical protein